MCDYLLTIEYTGALQNFFTAVYDAVDRMGMSTPSLLCSCTRHCNPSTGSTHAAADAYAIAAQFSSHTLASTQHRLGQHNIPYACHAHKTTQFPSKRHRIIRLDVQRATCHFRFVAHFHTPSDRMKQNTHKKTHTIQTLVRITM